MNYVSNFLYLCFVVGIWIVVDPQVGLTQTDKQSETEASESEFSDQQIEFFENKVRPLLVEHCFDCHGPDASPIEGGLSLASRNSILAGGDTGPGIIPGQAQKSLVIDAINYGEVYEMPPDTKLSNEDIATLTRWVNEGAAWPHSENEEHAVKEEFDLQARKAEHWCWQPVRKPDIPEVKHPSWTQDPIDAFILAKVESAGLNPAGPAERRVLIRRAYFDLVGLPPSSAQVDAFVADQSDNAFEKVVDSLLASPHFGERWARHWMDLTRYAETGGHEFDYPIPFAFRYRDYLIRAFNEDVSYKSLIEEHIAGDLLPNPRRHPTQDYDQSVLGTGFWFLGEAKHGAVDSRDEEARTFDNQIDVMTKSFLGLTVACARCHDHKFDAISADDYYALAGFLQSSRRQAAMLDPGRKIEKQFEDVQQLVTQADAAAEDLLKRVQHVDVDRTASYLNAAIQFLRNDPEWNGQETIVIEGESMKQLSLSGGQSEIQKIKPQGDFSWQGDQQFRWKDADLGDTWELQFEIPDLVDPADYKISAVLTLASDYGTTAISINDDVVQKSVECFHPQLATRKVDLGQRKLNPGANLLKFEVKPPASDAIPRNMIGVDYLQLIPVQKLAQGAPATVKQIATQHELDPSVLERLVAALKDPAVQAVNHPLRLLVQSSRISQPIDSTFATEITGQLQTQQKQHDAWLKDSTPFADFNSGLPDGWFRTGYAFGTGELELPNFSSAGSMFPEPGVLNSGQFGTNFFGVIRSPTFELKHPNIHYRLRGKNVTIRLIIDGFTMDEYNALLYVGCKFNIQESDEFVWQTQSGDLKNHLGHRAHLEFIDHGNGYVVVDEIRFSDGANPVDAPSALATTLGDPATPFDRVESLSGQAAQSVADQLANPSQPEFCQLASWLVENDLLDLLGESDQHISSNPVPLTNSKHVALVDSLAETIDANVPTTTLLVARLKEMRKRIEELNSQTPAPLLGLAMTEGTGENEHVFIRGNHKTLGDVARRHFLSAISDRPLDPPDGSGRLQLAHKITAPNNPLTARVAVNRIWHHLTGRGIVASVDNFGVLGKQPTHPELLDYLATEFVADGWSVKQLIKRIMLSTTYQMSSQIDPEATKIDPENQLLHRARIRRLQGEAIRDAMLQVSGELDPKLFGPPVPIYLTDFMGGRGRPGKSGPLDGNRRRSIYISVRRNFLSPMMLAFDTPIPFNSIGSRNQSNVPAQALILMNDPFVIQQAEKWAEKLVADGGTPEDRIETIYRTALGRAPSADELEQAQSFIEQQASELEVPSEAIDGSLDIWRDMCHVVFNLKEFIYLN